MGDSLRSEAVTFFIVLVKLSSCARVREAKLAESKDPSRAWGFDTVARHSHGAFHGHSANALRLSMSTPLAPGSFDYVAARFATGNFAQDDNSYEG